jgi:hypothetical protein
MSDDRMTLAAMRRAIKEGTEGRGGEVMTTVVMRRAVKEARDKVVGAMKDLAADWAASVRNGRWEDAVRDVEAMVRICGDRGAELAEVAAECRQRGGLNDEDPTP